MGEFRKSGKDLSLFLLENPLLESDLEKIELKNKKNTRQTVYEVSQKDAQAIEGIINVKASKTSKPIQGHKKQNIILYGPPGTGKTYDTKAKVVRILEDNHDAN